jgi:DNA-binding NarL/FixJ family response regulator
MALRVVLVDDHRLIREGLKSYLSGQGVEIIGEGSNGLDGVRLARELQPDVLLMDLSMPVLDGLAATRMIQAERPEQAVVILTASEAEADLFEAVKSGARGYLLKSLEPGHLIGQLEAVARGEAAWTPTLAAKILHELARAVSPAPGAVTVPQQPARHVPVPAESFHPAQSAMPAGTGARPLDEIEPLTARERDVLQHLTLGASNREIAEALIISENTVKYHLKNILQKLHLRNRAQVVAYAFNRDRLEPPARP